MQSFSNHRCHGSLSDKRMTTVAFPFINIGNMHLYYRDRDATYCIGKSYGSMRITTGIEHNSVIMTEPDFSPAALPGQARAHPLATLKGDGL